MIFNNFDEPHDSLAISLIVHTFLLKCDNVESFLNFTMQINKQINNKCEVNMNNFLILDKLRLLPSKIYIEFVDSYKIIYDSI